MSAEIRIELVDEVPFVGPEGRGTRLIFEFVDAFGVYPVEVIVPEESPDETGET